MPANPAVTAEAAPSTEVSSDRKLGKVLITEEQLTTRVAELGSAISEQYQGRELILLGVLNGAILFLSDLVRSIRIPVSFDFLALSHYCRGSHDGDAVRIVKDTDLPIEGKHVVLVEDIIDTGLTLNFLLRSLEQRKPASVEVCTLLERPTLRLLPIPIRYVGFSIPNDFVVGYGLDYQDRYRHLPCIRLLNL